MAEVGKLRFPELDTELEICDEKARKVMKGATANAAGEAGQVPAPPAGAHDRKFLRGDGTWQVTPNTTYSAATQSANGLMSTADKKKLDGVAASANNYSHPTNAGNKHIPSGGSSGQILRWSADGTAAWGADNNTTYGVASQSANGLMSTADKKKLDGIAAGANVTPSGLSSGYVRTGLKAGTKAGDKATAEGNGCTASGNASHAEGSGCTASGSPSHAEGEGCVASGAWSHAGGYHTTAISQIQTVIGQYNANNGEDSSHIGTYLTIGNGSASAKSNAFRFTTYGALLAKDGYNSSGADYAEYFEWEDGNPENEDRRGYFVTMGGDKIRKADAADSYILGIISTKPVVIGNSDPDGWHSTFIRDEFGNYVMKKEVEKRITGEAEVEVEVDSYVHAPDYDPDKPYIPRSDRPEWDAVGMLGVLAVHDDGTCQVNGYCKASDGGVATASDTGWRVIARVTENIVKVVFR